ncbi:MAG TPA: sodium:solute symporter [Candidatus Aminicenantes bacterium]|nr:sodium:solute symporter [Candidatus Aminicenantes bacterium]HRY64670.1 sodium:solute symporter [Candidatus Aminicenantes bacterium]HRZ71583.1 sodium:solute symporter [Candidatus Aminicenantes bacterium]
MTLTIGWLGLRKARTFTDYFLGGRTVGPWMSAFTYAAAYFSAVLFIGFAGKIGWGFGLSGLWIALGNALVGVLGVWGLLGDRIRRMSVELQVTTMPEFLEKRYASPFLKLIASLAVFLLLVPYSAAVFIGLSYLFKANFGFGFGTALLVMGLFTAFYLVLGGYKSMTMIDVVFGMIMCLGSAVLIGSTIKKIGGLGALTSGLAAIDPKLTAPVGPGGAWPLFALVFLTSIAPFAMPQLVQKFYAIRDRRAIRRGMIASTLFSLLIAGAAYFTGASARLFLTPATAPAAFAGGKPVFDILMPEFLAKVVPPSLSVLMMLLILSASMSTLAALVLISSSSVVKDLYAGFVNPAVSDKTLTRMMRIMSAVFVLLSVVLAYLRPATIVAILSVSWGAIGSFFLGPFVWGLISRKATKFGAVGSAVLGLGTCLGLALTGMPPAEAGTIGMVVSFATTPLLSLISWRESPAARDAGRQRLSSEK